MPSLCLCLEQLNICQDLAIVVREFDTEPLILKNRSRRVNPKEWDFCVLASDCSSCFSWHQWVNNSWASAAAGLSSISLESSSSSSWPAAGERKGGFQRKEAAQPQRKSLALTTFQTAFRTQSLQTPKDIRSSDYIKHKLGFRFLWFWQFWHLERSQAWSMITPWKICLTSEEKSFQEKVKRRPAGGGPGRGRVAQLQQVFLFL